MDEPKRKIYEFGDFRLDVLRLALERIDGAGIALKPKACQILLALIERRERAVSKEELMSILWPDSYVEEGNLTVNLSMLRKALGDNAGRQQFIVTVPGKGYRFVAGVRESTEGPAPSRDAPKKSRAGIYLGAALLLAGLAIYGFYKFRTPAAAPSFENFRLTKLTTSGKVATAAVSPDGRYVAYVINESSGQSIWLKQLSTGSDVQIVPREPDTHFPGIAFSNDGENLFVLKSGKDQPNALYRTAALGGAFERLADDVDSLPAISPDGKILVFARGLPDQSETALFTLYAGDAETQRLVSRPSAEGFNIGVRPAWSPDGTKIVTAIRKQDENGKYSVLAAIDPRNGNLEELPSPRFAQIEQLAWAPGNDALIAAGATVESPSLSQIVRISYPGGAVRRITNDLDDYGSLSLTADGKTIVTVNTNLQTNMWTVPFGADMERAVQVTSANYDGANGLAWMPDGSILYTSRGAGRLDLWKLTSGGETKQQITSNAGDNFQPAVSSDGKSIAFVSNRSGRQNVWMADADGGNPRRITEGTDDGSPDFSPDGKTIVYRSYIKGNPAIFSLDIASGASKQLTDKISGRPQFSPDGGKILCSYRSEALGPQRLSIIPALGGEPEKVFDFTSSLFRWRNNDSFLFIGESDSGAMNLWLHDTDEVYNVAPGPVTLWNSDRIYWFDISADGKTIACARGTSQSDVVLITSEPAVK